MNRGWSRSLHPRLPEGGRRMLDMLTKLIAGLAMHIVTAEAGSGGDTTPQLVIDLFNLQWWQALGALAVALGLSPAPWILGLAVNRLQFTKTAEAAHQREIDEMKAAHERELTARERSYESQRAQLLEYHGTVIAAKEQRYADLERTNQRNVEVAESQRKRADEVTAALAESTKAVQMTNHVLEELRRSAEEATPSG